jgi:hypothetical protein
MHGKDANNLLLVVLNEQRAAKGPSVTGEPKEMTVSSFFKRRKRPNLLSQVHIYTTVPRGSSIWHRGDSVAVALYSPFHQPSAV